MRLGDEVTTVTGGTAVRVAPETPRSHRNEGDEPVELWAVSRKIGHADATKLDAYPGAYPPTDTGSSGVGVAKAAKAKGWISGYQHTFNLNSALRALAVTPVIIGINWYEGFDSPHTTGELRVAGSIRGGHEVVLDQLDVEQKRVWLTNSWGTSFGLHGRAFFTWDTFSRLLSEQGDCTVPVPLTAPAPTPTPTPTPTSDDVAMWDAAKTWARAKGLPA